MTSINPTLAAEGTSGTGRDHSATSLVRYGTVTAKAVTTTLWRVSGRDDRVLGHVRLVDTRHGQRYAATLILPGGVRTLFLGEFWSLNDALDCFV